MTERRLSLKDIRVARKINFHNEQSPHAYPVFRSLTSKYLTSEAGTRAKHLVDGYVETLPAFEGRNLIQLIDEKLESSPKARLLDVGCGQGRFLIDCRRKWGVRVDCSGISAYSYHRNKTEQRLGELGIDVKVGDAQSLLRHFSPESFDMVTSVWTARYMADPMAFLKGVYRILRPGGIALIHQFPFFAAEFPSVLKSQLRLKYGMQIAPAYPDMEYIEEDIAFRKTCQKLHLPLGYGQVNNDAISTRRFSYSSRFTPNSFPRRS